MKKKFAKCIMNSAFILGCAFVLNGCEGGGGDSHDFGTNDPNIVVAMGDSITAGEGASASYPALLGEMSGKTVVNEGSAGAVSQDGAGKVGRVLENYKPGYLLILYGANDIISGENVENTIVDLRNIIAAAINNKTVPIIATLTPMYGGHAIFGGAVPGLNARIKQLADEQGCELVDLEGAFGNDSSLFQEDGLHPNDAGQDLIARSFSGAL